jgi:beta-lactamase superfamily II metal-dependent hydrolase
VTTSPNQVGTSLAATFIDVGWGDSILLESVDGEGIRRFGLIDCNDTVDERSSLMYVKRFFDREGIARDEATPTFEWVLLTHGHADHARGMKRLLKEFGTRHFWYPKSVPNTTHAALLRFVKESPRVRHHQAVDRSKIFGTSVNFGSIQLKALWPDHDSIDPDNENNNSVVLAATLNDVTFLFTGDAEASNWSAIHPRIPDTVKVFQVPHHGALNGVFLGDTTPWMTAVEGYHPQLAISCHITPFGHPHNKVVEEITARSFLAYRTDQHSHVTFSTDGSTVTTRYSHI